MWKGARGTQEDRTASGCIHAKKWDVRKFIREGGGQGTNLSLLASFQFPGCMLCVSVGFWPLRFLGFAGETLVQPRTSVSRAFLQAAGSRAGNLHWVECSFWPVFLRCPCCVRGWARCYLPHCVYFDMETYFAKTNHQPVFFYAPRPIISHSEHPLVLLTGCMWCNPGSW